jgi:SAM-dependent methyltransferase
VSFFAASDAYDRFMGRFSTPLGPLMADFAGVERGQKAVDVGCGPGALTAELVARLGAENVAAADPSEPFAESARERNPGADVRVAPAEQLPFDDAAFDVALAQLVVSFMSDPVRGLREMARVVRPGGVVAVSVWDLAGGRAPLSPFWDAVADLHPRAADESLMPGARAGHLAELMREADLVQVEDTALRVSLDFRTFEEWWEPYTLGVGPAGAFARSLAPDDLAALRERCSEQLGPAPFAVEGYAWAARGTTAA